MPTRCNRGFYCRSYCFLNMFRASLCPSSGAQEYYTVFAACGVSCCGFFKQLVWCGAEGYASGLQDAGLPLLHLFGILFSHINDDARSKSHQIKRIVYSNKQDNGICNVPVSDILVRDRTFLPLEIQGSARNVIPLIVHVTHFYYYKNI